MRFRRLPKKSEIKKVYLPSTATEYLEQGSIDEESGERWLGSDVSKCLRFFNKAYSNYIQAIKLDPKLLDAHYNSVRLLLHTYQTFKRIPSGHDIAIENASLEVVQNISDIRIAYENSLERVQQLGQVPNDLLYNYAIVYLEWLESQQEEQDDESSLSMEELERFVNDLQNIDTNNFSGGDIYIGNSSSSSDKTKQEELTSEEVVQPTDLFETVLSSYKLIQSVYENASSNDLIQTVSQSVAPLLQINDNVANELIIKYSESSHVNSMISNITLKDVNELKLVKLNLLALAETDIFRSLDIWKNDNEIPETLPEKFMVASDSVQALLDRNDINLLTVNSQGTESDKDTFWKILTFQNNMLKRAQELLNESMQLQKKSNLQSEDLGSLIVQVSEVIIARADIELQRSSINNYSSSVNNHSVLMTNCKNLLKNAINIANLNGGLRERMMVKINREQCKLEAVFRLCILENRTSIEELDKVMTRNKWVNELPNLKKSGLYDDFGLNKIIVP
ncbi:hypothetical protein FOB64_001982 [Candida albicans]|uniref:Uncharacterized protein n=1 Tax=Candida albicans TaxID=5476 RepID=A0A8H6F543_CANAX|nr:hypothetical protein FOB64_001982 [Candida albicans]